MTDTADFVIIGGGILGLAVSLDLRRRFRDSSVLLLEKEGDVGLHASTRNSGVLHAGFYYSADSLKARLTVEGNRRLTAYCEERGLKVRRCGKLVVTRDETELDALGELASRGRANGVQLEEVSAAQAREIEPYARTCEAALFSPTTSSVDPAEVVASLRADAAREGVTIRTGTRYVARRDGGMRTDQGNIAAGFVVNAAGVYADRVAHDFGFGDDLEILPFKGLYLYQASGAERLRTHIYPVPDLRFPWLGVHFTVTVDGRVTIGPTATPALWREHYGGFDRFDARELASIVSREAMLFLSDTFGFRRLAWLELRKYSRDVLVGQASGLAGGIRAEDFREWARPGIRAQLYNRRTRRLEMDFCLQGDDNSLHILNAVSPAFTCALSFAELVGERIASSVQG